jgi:hypothetical protein
MHTVVETPTYLAAAKSAGMNAEIRAEIVAVVAVDPKVGDLIAGTHGLRKFRHARAGGGKSGGFRVITYFHSTGLPVFLTTAFGKNQKANLSDAEATALGRMVKSMAETYRKRESR